MTTHMFYTFLRAGLCNDPKWLADAPEMSEVDWHKLIRLGIKTGTIGIIGDGVNLYSKEHDVPNAIMNRLVMAQAQLMQSHARHNAAIAELDQLIKSQGILPVILKGQSVAKFYHTPQRRACGDIDLFIGDEHLWRLKEFFNTSGIGCQEIKEGNKHDVMMYKGISVELHRYPAFLHRRSANRSWQQWWLESVRNRTDVPVTVNAFFLFHHLLHHFMSHEVMFRQFCDLARFLYGNFDDIDLDLLRSKLVEYKVMLPWQTFMSVLVEYFGLSENRAPFYSSDFRRKATKVVKRLDVECLCRTKHKHYKGIAHKTQAFWLHIKSNISTFTIFPSETIAYIPSYIKDGLKAVLKP